jgi:hypothetical protein
MSEIFHDENLIEETQDDGWQNLDWHDWKLAIKDKTMLEYLEKQTKDAIDWYCRTTGNKIDGYERNKKLLEYDKETIEKINKAVEAYLAHIDEESSLTGSENFARKHLMYRSDRPEEEIEKKYLGWMEKERDQKEKMALEHVK